METIASDVTEHWPLTSGLTSEQVVEQAAKMGAWGYRLLVSQHPTKWAGLEFCVSHEESVVTEEITKRSSVSCGWNGWAGAVVSYGCGELLGCCSKPLRE